MAKLGSLYISLIADTAAFSSGLNKAKSDTNSAAAAMNRVLASVDKQFHGIGETVKDFGKEIFSLRGAAAALFGTIGIGSLVEMAKQALEAVGGLGELAAQLGVTTDTLQAFHYAGTQVGVSNEQMDTSLAKLTKTIGEAASGNKTAIDSFEKFGIKILDAQGKVRPTEDVLRDMATRLKEIPDPAQRAALATELMGRAGQKMIPFLIDGADGMDTLVTKAKALGLVLNSETIESAHNASIALATMSEVLKVNLQGALVQLAPYIEDFANTLTGVISKTQDFLKWNATLPLDASLHNLKDAQEKFAAEQQAFADDPERAFNVYGITQEGLNQAEADIKRQIKDIHDYAQRYGLMDYPGVPPVEGGKHSAVKPSVPVATGRTVGVSNPADPGVAKSAANNIDKMEAKLRELQAQLDDVNTNALQDGLAKATVGFDQSSDRAKALAFEIAVLTRQMNLTKLADEAYAAQQKADAAGVQEWDAEMQKGRDTLQSLRTPIEIYRDRLAELQQLHQDGAISEATFYRGLDDAEKNLSAANSSASTLNTTMTELGSTFSSAFDDAVISGKSLHDILIGLTQDVERLLLRAGEGNLADFLTGSNGNTRGGSSGGFLGSILSLLGVGGGLNSSKFRATGAGPGASSNTNTSGGGFLGFFTDILGSIFHAGGIVGTGGRSRSVPAFAFANAPRLHGGAFIGPGEVPAILEKGETVLPKGYKASSSGAVHFHYAPVIDARGASPSDVAKIKAISDQSAKDAVMQFKASINTGGPDSKLVGRRRR